MHTAFYVTRTPALNTYSPYKVKFLVKYANKWPLSELRMSQKNKKKAKDLANPMSHFLHVTTPNFGSVSSKEKSWLYVYILIRIFKALHTFHIKGKIRSSMTVKLRHCVTFWLQMYGPKLLLNGHSTLKAKLTDLRCDSTPRLHESIIYETSFFDHTSSSNLQECSLYFLLLIITAPSLHRNVLCGIGNIA